MSIQARTSNDSESPVLLAPRTAAQLLSVSERTLARLAANGHITPIRLGSGRVVRYSRAAIEALADQAAVAVPAPAT